MQHGVPSLHRVHEAPDIKKVEEFEAFIAPLGYSLAATGQALRPRHFQRLIDRMKGTPEERPIAALMLRTMQKARYDAVSLGHFGLAAEHYTHFTSPIRRYPDLVVHRMLRQSAPAAPLIARRGSKSSTRSCPRRRATPPRWSGAPTTPSASCCSGRRCASWPTRSATSSTGFVTGVAPFGLFVELVEHYVEGPVHVSSMADDYYRFVEQQHVLYGENTKKTYRLGDRVPVQVVRVDLERRQIDLGLVEILEAVRQSRAGRGRASRVKPASSESAGARPGRRERAAKKGGRSASSGRRRLGSFAGASSVLSAPSRVASLKLRMPLPMPRPSSGNRFAPKITTGSRG